MRVKSIILIMILCCFASITAQEDNKIGSLARIHQLKFDLVSDIKWSPDGTRLAVVSFPSLYILDTTTWDAILFIEDANIPSIQWSPDGTNIAAVQGGLNESLLIWDANSGELLKRFDRNEMNRVNGQLGLYILSWSPDATMIASDSSGLSMLIWDIETGDILVVEGHGENGVREIDWSPDSTRIVSGGADTTIRIWDAEDFEQLLVLEGSGFLDWHPTDNLIVGASLGSTFVVVWDTVSGEALLRIEQEEPVFLMRWNYDGTLIATSTLEVVVSIWDGQLGTFITKIDLSGEIIKMLDWHPNQNILAVAGLDGFITILGFE